MKLPLVIIGVCAAVFLAGLGLSVAAGPDDAFEVGAETEQTRKDGDMWIMWYGTRTVARRDRARSSRVESPSNRTIRGGGLHGGK